MLYFNVLSTILQQNQRQITMYKIYILYREWLAKCKNLFVNIIFQWLLKKLISKSPHVPPHVHTCVLWAKVPFHSSSLFCFLQVRIRDFTWRTTNFTFRQSNRSQIKLLCDKDCTCLNRRHWMSEDVAQDQNPEKIVTVNSMFNVFEVAIFFYRTDINIRAIY